MFAAAGEADQAFDSWKQIAVFLRRGVRTVQRWERTEGLPVRRHQHLKRGTVFAFPSELLQWAQSREVAVANRSRNALGQQVTEMRRLTRQHRMLAGELQRLIDRNIRTCAEINLRRAKQASDT